MPDIIHQLPDNIANQIAAGEVIQRPASAVKELLENAVDAGATEVELIVADAGKQLVQVADNGRGMSLTDARMAFERHATSKISSIEDLFHIRTMGFRGEALASIAAVAQVELKTRTAEDELGTFIEIENSRVAKQEPIQRAVGTTIAMKNLFFNVPARRNFLKSNTTELRNIMDEFTRVAMAFPQIHFSLVNNGQQMFFLEKGSLKQRVVQLLGNAFNSRLIPVQEETDYLKVHGFVAKPEAARKTRGDQYFFVNNRFIKSAYLNHAVTTAFSNLLPKDSFAAYVLFIDLDPGQVDINVHPTKQEIKFTDEKIAYAFVQSAVKHALAQYSITPSLDFTLNPQIQTLDAVNRPATQETQAEVQGGNLYQTFTQKHQAHKIEPGSGLQPWRSTRQQDVEIQQALGKQTGPDSPWKSELEKLRDIVQQPTTPAQVVQQERFEFEPAPVSKPGGGWMEDIPPTQIHHTYILATIERGFMLVNQQFAHERVIYNRLTRALAGKPVHAQQSLFPITFELPPADAALLQELLPDLHQMGFQVEGFGKNSFVVHGSPADTGAGGEQKAIEQILDQVKHSNPGPTYSLREKLTRAMAWQQSIKPGRVLSTDEMKMLLSQLFSGRHSALTPDGKPIYLIFSMQQLEKMMSAQI